MTTGLVVTAGGSDGTHVRRATGADVPALVQLRDVMLTAMGERTGDAHAPWRTAATDWFTEQLQRRDTFAAFVVEGEAGVLSGAVGSVELRGPGPAIPTGELGRIFSVATAPEFRGRGHARSCLRALLHWFEHSTGVAAIELTATPYGIGLYEALGFSVSPYPGMRLRLPRTDSPR